METNFESTYGQKQKNIRKATYAKKAALQGSTTRNKNKQEWRQMQWDLEKGQRMLIKTTLAGFDSAKDTEQMEEAEHRRKGKQPSS